MHWPTAEFSRLIAYREDSVLFPGSATTLESKPLINGNRHVVLRVVKGKNDFDSFEAGVADETNRAFRQAEIKGFVGVIGPIRNTLIVDPRLGIS